MKGEFGDRYYDLMFKNPLNGLLIDLKIEVYPIEDQVRFDLVLLESGTQNEIMRYDAIKVNAEDCTTVHIDEIGKIRFTK